MKRSVLDKAVQAGILSAEQAGYLGYLAGRVFKDSLLFPFALSLIGLAIIALGVL